jgi:quinol monooxygenase YgiN
MLVVIEVIKSVHGKEEALKKVLQDIVPISRKGRGCVQYELFEPTAGNGEFLIIMKWKSKEDLTLHETSKHVDDFIKKFDAVLYTEVTQYSEWEPVI